jgi:capsular exopolysaccharide synthesis family protein
MSRIHEALRKAKELEQAGEISALDVLAESLPARTRPPSSPAPAEAPASQSDPAMDVMMATVTVPEALPENGTAPVPESDPLFPDGPAEIVPQEPEAWLSLCRAGNWSPNPHSLLFLGSEREHSVEYEQFRTLRSRLYQIRAQQPLKTILIASALPAEGKTFVAANLALALVKQHGRRVLLVDADLRRPRLHELLGAEASPGLTEYLDERTDEISAIQRAPVPNLYFMPGGRVSSDPSGLVGNDRLARLITRIAPAFDWIVVDTPPAVPVSDASLMAEACDGIILVVKANSTPYDVAQKACNEFRQKPVVGVVLNRTGRSSGYGDYYYKIYSSEQAANATRG